MNFRPIVSVQSEEMVRIAKATPPGDDEGQQESHDGDGTNVDEEKRADDELCAVFVDFTSPSRVLSSLNRRVYGAFNRPVSRCFAVFFPKSSLPSRMGTDLHIGVQLP